MAGVANGGLIHNPVLPGFHPDPSIVFRGSPLGLTEGPHLYRHGGSYYLMVAEGGTSYDHAVAPATCASGVASRRSPPTARAWWAGGSSPSTAASRPASSSSPAASSSWRA